MMRGALTDEIKTKSIELLGYKITQKELRLLPYLMFVIMNNQFIDQTKINDEERKILANWGEKGFIHLSSNNVAITKQFYDVVNELLFIAYIKQCDNELEVHEK